ncbi:MAG TPA: cation:dicarboxylase symporter family transporter, partial [Firmicutes bacterium]|nr:cation:dicarboxylase symporter family transporter [Bacillota bacterium]
NSAGIPVGGIALIIGVDRILDMCRTSINVTSDLTACIVIDKWLGGNMVSNHKIAQGT